MNFFKFLYDVFVWITNNYSQLPDSFKKSFPESICVEGRIFLSNLVQSDSDLNEIFKDYE